jgi:hypothetical protein
MVGRSAGVNRQPISWQKRELATFPSLAPPRATCNAARHSCSGGSPDPCQPPFCPGISLYPPGHPSPLLFSRRPSLLGSSSPAGALCLFCVGLPVAPAPSGFPRSASRRCGRGGRHLYSEAVVFEHAVKQSTGLGAASLPHLWPVIAALANGCDDLLLRSLNDGSLAFARPVFPWPGSPGWFGLPLDVSPCYEAVRYRSRPSGRGRVEHSLVFKVLLLEPLLRCDLVSHCYPHDIVRFLGPNL